MKASPPVSANRSGDELLGRSYGLIVFVGLPPRIRPVLDDGEQPLDDVNGVRNVRIVSAHPSQDGTALPELQAEAA